VTAVTYDVFMRTDDDLFRPPAPKEFSRKLVAMLKIEDGRKVAGPYGKGYPQTDKSFMRARHAQPSYALWAGHPPNGIMAVWGMARPQGGRPAAVFFHLGYPFPYGPGRWSKENFVTR
jgi:hypothetical protein